MKSAISKLLHSEAFWSAHIGLLSTVVMRYLNVPDDIWQAFLALIAVIVASFAIDELGLSIGRGLARGLEELNK